ncbi:Zinc finger CCCH domain protein [Quillaja saponaria]|uniref:Zinc finger CCCH domain protein n=1 Tax=Quillaja saponaria TaxID=32244 RepID=A0AAD7VH66_QUISA|nr:Zinc finger CCCH domain protein [Quillaja saponaria]
MDYKFEAAPFEWVEEFNGQVNTPMRMKRKVRSKKKEFVGWGSKSLIDFLESIGKDTSKQISQYDVTAIINDYVNKNNLLHPDKKKRIICDEWLLTLFGRKTISRIKIYDMLESHYAENHEESEDDSQLSSDGEEYGLATSEKQRTSSERKTHPKKKVMENPKSCFAAIIPSNIKLVYLKRSLVEDLLKDPETFEGKVVGSFVRNKCDPNDYLQKNSHQLLQVTGIKKTSGTKDINPAILLQVSCVIKDISVGVLSDDNFSEEECVDLRQRVEDGLLKRPTVVEFEQKVRILHEDITNHWLIRELALLQNLIDRANEKGWRRDCTLFEYLERRQLLQTPIEQARLLSEVPEVIADDLEPESTTHDIPENLEQGKNSQNLLQTQHGQEWLLHGAPQVVADNLVPKATIPDIPDNVKQQNNSPRSILSGASAIPLCNMDGTVSNWTSHGANSAVVVPLQEQPKQPIEFTDKIHSETHPTRVESKMICQGAADKGVLTSTVIELSDDEDNEEPSAEIHVPLVQLDSPIWHYIDPQGDVQGPFSLTSLKRWSDAEYFSADFKVWRIGQNQDEAGLLTDILRQTFQID